MLPFSDIAADIFPLFDREVASGLLCVPLLQYRICDACTRASRNSVQWLVTVSCGIWPRYVHSVAFVSYEGEVRSRVDPYSVMDVAFR